jgi:hypothetical protein
MALPNKNIWIGLNRAVEAWSLKTWQMQSQHLQAAIKKGTDGLVSSLRRSIGKKDQMVERAGFSFEKSGIYLAKGVGGVYKVNPEGSGIVVRTTDGPFNRHPADWISPVMEEQLPDLTKIVAEQVAKAAGPFISETIEVAARGLK